MFPCLIASQNITQNSNLSESVPKFSEVINNLNYIFLKLFSKVNCYNYLYLIILL